MPRIVQVTVPAAQTGPLLARLATLDELMSLRVDGGVSLKPPGDIVTIAVADRRMPRLMQLLDESGITASPECSTSTSRPACLISTTFAESITRDSSESSWEEMENVLNQESCMTPSSMLTMAIAGAVATIGILNDALHLVIAAMVIAPGFEPLSRLALGLVSGSPAWRRGLADSVKAYLALIGGALLATFVAGGTPGGEGYAAYLSDDVLFRYWTTFSVSGLLVTLLAGVAGAVLIVNHRSVLTAGVMIALALIPAAALVGMGIASGDAGMTLKGGVRLLAEAGLVLLTSLAVFGWRRYRFEQRNMAM